tara:strand:- start:171 stop:419 length:249 start_codon:yes stop_codon:yes gene_type:complete
MIGTARFDDFKKVYSVFLIDNDFLCFFTKSGVWLLVLTLMGIFICAEEDYTIETFCFFNLELDLYGLSNVDELLTTIVFGIP